MLTGHRASNLVQLLYYKSLARHPQNRHLFGRRVHGLLESIEVMLPAVEAPRAPCLSDQYAFSLQRPRPAWRCRRVVQAPCSRSVRLLDNGPTRHVAQSTRRATLLFTDRCTLCSRSADCSAHPSRRDTCTAAGAAAFATLVQGWAAVPAALADGSDAPAIDTTITDRVYMDIGAFAAHCALRSIICGSRDQRVCLDPHVSHSNFSSYCGRRALSGHAERQQDARLEVGALSRAAVPRQGGHR